MEAHAIISQCGPRDAKYLLEHLLTMTLGLVGRDREGIEKGKRGREGGKEREREGGISKHLIEYPCSYYTGCKSRATGVSGSIITSTSQDLRRQC